MNKYLRCKSCGHEEVFTFDKNLFGPEIKLPRCHKCKKNDWEHSEDVKRKWKIKDTIRFVASEDGCKQLTICCRCGNEMTVEFENPVKTNIVAWR